MKKCFLFEGLIIIRKILCFRQNSLKSNRMLKQKLYFLTAKGSSFLIHFVWLRGHHAKPEVNKLISFLWILGHHAMLEVTSLISYNPFDLWDTTPWQSSALSFATQPVFRIAEGFPRSGKYPKFVPPRVFLDYLQPV